jgi:hypothetical protein
MPTYDGRCDSCGEFNDIMRATEYIERGGLSCPICKEPAVTLIRKAPAIIGPLPSKTLHIDQIGQNFSSVEEERAYFSRRKDRAIVSKSDPLWINHRDQAHNRADESAKQQGFRDHEDRKSFLRKDNAHRAASARGEKKIQITTS